MITTNGKEVVFSGFFSMKAGDEVVITHPGLGSRVMRFNAVENVSELETQSNFELGENEVRLPIPLLATGQRGMENQFLGMVGTARLSARYILQGAGLFTIVNVEFFVDRTPR